MRAYRYLPEVIAYSWQASVAKPSASEHMAAVIVAGGTALAANDATKCVVKHAHAWILTTCGRNCVPRAQIFTELVRKADWIMSWPKTKTLGKGERFGRGLVMRMHRIVFERGRRPGCRRCVNLTSSSTRYYSLYIKALTHVSGISISSLLCTCIPMLPESVGQSTGAPAVVSALFLLIAIISVNNLLVTKLKLFAILAFSAVCEYMPVSVLCDVASAYIFQRRPP
jgi:hypothetical protein